MQKKKKSFFYYLHKQKEGGKNQPPPSPPWDTWFLIYHGGDPTPPPSAKLLQIIYLENLSPENREKSHKKYVYERDSWYNLVWNENKFNFEQQL